MRVIYDTVGIIKRLSSQAMTKTHPSNFNEHPVRLSVREKTPNRSTMRSRGSVAARKRVYTPREKFVCCIERGEEEPRSQHTHRGLSRLSSSAAGKVPGEPVLVLVHPGKRRPQARRTDLRRRVPVSLPRRLRARASSALPGLVPAVPLAICAKRRARSPCRGCCRRLLLIDTVMRLRPSCHEHNGAYSPPPRRPCDAYFFRLERSPVRSARH